MNIGARKSSAGSGHSACRAAFGAKLLLAGCAVVAVAGCGSASDRAMVSGSVKLDGQAVQSGSIAFYPTDGTHGPSAGGAIEEGRYRIEAAKGVVPGKNRVEINAPKKSGRMIPDPMNSAAKVEEYVEGVPPQYNEKSTLVRDVAAGKNEIDFDLTTK